MKKFTLLAVLLLSQLIFSQKGVISGKVIDEAMNDSLPFASVMAKGTTTGNSTDFDGKYSFEIEPGNYTIVFSFVGYTTVEISDVSVVDGQETIVDVVMKPSSSSLKEVVITTTSRKNTEKAIINLQKKSATVVDGLSIQSIKKSGASNVAAAVKQVPGVSIQGGKFIVVRGLSDRYSKTTLNGLDVPGLDPDRNSLQVDLFPTNILENLVVNKTASADLPADFTGGIVDITLKDFSNKPEYTISASFGYNPTQHFNSNYQSIDKGSLGFLGFSDNRDLVIDRDYVTPNALDAARRAEAREITLNFNPELRAPKEPNFANVNLGVTASNSYHIGESNTRIGYQANLNYRSNTNFYKNAIDGTFIIDSQSSESDELVGSNFGEGPLSVHETLFTGLAGLSLKTGKSKFRLSGLFIRNGLSNSSTRLQDVEQIGGGGFSRLVDENTYTEKTIANFLLGGAHKFNDWNIDWKLSPTLSNVDDLDHRITPLTINQNNDGTSTLDIDAASGSPFRIWRFLEEQTFTGKFDVTKKYGEPEGLAGKLKFGALGTLKQRDFSLVNYRFIAENANFDSVETANPNVLFLPENIIDAQTGVSDPVEFSIGGGQTFEDVNAFDAEQSTYAGYISNEIKFDFFRAILGLRVENFTINYTGLDANNNELNNEEIINTIDFFPSANLVFAINEKANLRLSYSKTTARPSFREASTNNIFDPVTGRRFIGALAFEDEDDLDGDGDTTEGIRLKPTFIDNIDVRLEYFGDDGDGVAFSSFVKYFEDAIELTFPVTAGTISPRNLDNAFLYGVEFEARKNFGFVGLSNLSAKFNVSIVESQVDIISGQEVQGSSDTTRTLQGQAPYTINALLEYKNDNGFIANLNYNVQGETLEVVGVNLVPSVFTQPFDNLILNSSKSFGDHKISFKATNLLGDVQESFYKLDGVNDEFFSKRVPNRTFTIGYSYKF